LQLLEATWSDPAQHFFERQCVIQQRETHEQQLDQQLLLATLAEAGLQIAQHVEHAKYIAGRKPR